MTQRSVRDEIETAIDGLRWAAREAYQAGVKSAEVHSLVSKHVVIQDRDENTRVLDAQRDQVRRGIISDMLRAR